MSELRAYRIKGNTLGDFDDVYIKSEADKVIAHQKYRRCLAMVKYCEYRFMNLEKIIDTEYRTKKMRFSHRWWVKWLNLADKFKELAKAAGEVW